MTAPAVAPARGYPLRTLLLLLMLVLVLPPLVLAALMVGRSVEENRQATDRRLLDAARGLTERVEVRLAAGIRTLSALAASDSLTRGDLERFREEALRYGRVYPAWYAVLLTAPDGRQLVNTGRPNEPLPDTVDPESLQEVLATRGPVLGNLVRGRNGKGRLGLAMRVPVIRRDKVVYVLSAVVTPEGLAEGLSLSSNPDEWVRVILDANAVVVARTREPERFIGNPASPSFLALIDGHEEGVFESVTLDGQAVFSAVSRGQATGWRSVVAVPRRVVEAQLRRTLLVLGVVGVLLVGLGGAGSYFIARWIARDISMVAAAAAALVVGRPATMTTPRVDEVRQLADAIARSSELIKERERERDARVSRADAARAEAEAATRAKDEFLAMLGHELRNPLAPVLNALHLARAEGGVMGERERQLIERQVRHMARLVDDLLDMSRLRRGMVTLLDAPADLGRVVAEAVEMTGPLFEENGQRLSIEVPRSLQLMGDEDRLTQVVTNLLSNAAKYTPRGGSIALSAVTEGDDVVLQCADDGIGIGADLLPRVFDLFVQGTRGIDRRQGGLGLGLAVTRTLVELHGGTVTAHSDGPGLGSVFVVRLPRRAGELAARPAPAAASAVTPPAMPVPNPAHAGVRIMVVEDHDDVRDMLVRVLTMNGVEAKGVSTGAAGLKLAAEWAPDVGVLDIGLPDMDGFELAKRLRAYHTVETLHLVALTGYGGDSYANEAQAAGFDEFLIKPLGVDALLAIVARLRGRTRL